MQLLKYRRLHHLCTGQRFMSEHTEQALIDLQTRLSFQDDLIQQLDTALTEQSQALSQCEARLKQVEQQLKTLLEQRQEGGHSLLDEIPPHY